MPTPSSIDRIPFSFSFFEALTFGDLPLLRLPLVLPPSSIYNYTLDYCPQALPFLDLISIDEPIPHPDDIQPVISRVVLEAAPAVYLEIGTPSGLIRTVYSLAKLRLCEQIHNNVEAVQLARNLYFYLDSNCTELRSSTAAVEFLTPLRIRSPARGFLSRVPLWTLGTLIGETTVFDEVLDLRMETTFLACHVVSPSPRIFMCPSQFGPSILEIHRQSIATFNSSISRIRHSLANAASSHMFGSLGFLLCDAGHYTSFFYTGTSTLLCGDSISTSTPRNIDEVVAAFNAFLEGTGLQPVKRVQMMDIAYQGAGSRSCALAAFNGIECLVSAPGVAKWNPDPDDANGHRDRWVVDILDHTLHSLAYPESLDWYQNSCDIDLQVDSEELFSKQTETEESSYGWTDWNDQTLLSSHPFLSLYGGIGNPTASPSISMLSLASQSSPSRSPFHEGSAVTSPPFNLVHTPYMPSTFPESVASRNWIPDVTLGSDSLPRDTTPSEYELINSPSTSRSSTPTRTQRHPIVISSTSPPASHMRRQRPYSPTECIDLTFSPSPSPRTASPPTRQTCQSRPASFIDLCSSSDKENTPPFRVVQQRTPKGSELGSDIPILPRGRFETGGTQCAPLLQTRLCEGTEYNCLDDGIRAVQADGEAFGYVLRRGQSKRVDGGDGDLARLTMRCQSYGVPLEKHDLRIHPEDHRKGKSIRKNCSAHVNLVRTTGTDSFYIRTIDIDHSHLPILPPGGKARHPPTESQKSVASTYGTKGFSRKQINTILSVQKVGHQLEPSQISNVINAARQEARQVVESTGGDAATVLARLEVLQLEDPRWRFRTQFDADGKLTSIWWQSPLQVELAMRYGDVLIYDDTYNRNQYGYPLNIGVVIDNFALSRNVWYCFHYREDTPTHRWILQCYKSSISRAPETIATDRDAAIDNAVNLEMPTAQHIFCINHLDGNLTTNLQGLLGTRWQQFKSQWWDLYRSVSPEIFDRNFKTLVQDFPETELYLRRELYPVRARWAWAWVSSRFTAGVRTTSRVEVENRINRLLGGLKTTFVELFEKLNERTTDQASREAIAVRDSSRRHHPALWQDCFARVITLLEKHVGPYALHVLWQEMQKSVTYTVESALLPTDIRAWATSCQRQTATEPGYSWLEGEEKMPINDFANDSAYIATDWLLHQVLERNLDIKRIAYVTFKGVTRSSRHLVLLFNSDAFLCDCMMGVNVGIPCRHYLATLRGMPGADLRFHLGLIRARWLQDPTLDVTRISPVALSHIAHDRPILPSHLVLCNPLELPDSNSLHQPFATPVVPTRTVSHRETYAQTQAALKVVLRPIQTQEQLDRLLEKIHGLEPQETKKSAKAVSLKAPSPSKGSRKVLDPMPIIRKGRPSSSRLVAAREGVTKHSRSARNIAGPLGQRQLPNPRPNPRPQRPAVPPSPTESNPSVAHSVHDGDSDPDERPRKRVMRRCTNCREPGHNKSTCKLPPRS